ncbi:MAG TPA: lysophospholipid acyltransferase family protein [Candidatus Dormibacteraeota bacterium]|nr:lysophospholipid acyltransferase family protein [Candidatus Dormibacteraeota bacterium]
MAVSPLTRALRIDPGTSLLVLNAPGGAEPAAGPQRFDVVVLYSANRAELDGNAARAMAALKSGGNLWMAYPKPGSRDTDLSRDHGWGALHGAGLIADRQVEVDASWNALRFRPEKSSEAVPAADMLPVGRRATFAYRAVRFFSVPALRAAFRFEIHGRDRIPREGTYIVIANHLGWLDALTIAMVFPIEPRIHFLADPTGMMRRKLEWALIRATGGIVPVSRERGGNEKLFAQANKCLGLGGALALFPEGDFGPREGSLLPFKRGFAHFAVEANVPVVPVGMSGPKDVWLGKRIRVFIGEPIPPAGKTVDEMHDLGEKAVAALLPEYVEPGGAKLLRRWLTGLF